MMMRDRILTLLDHDIKSLTNDDLESIVAICETEIQDRENRDEVSINE